MLIQGENKNTGEYLLQYGGSGLVGPSSHLVCKTVWPSGLRRLT